GLVVELKTDDDLIDVVENLKDDEFLKINFKSIKEGNPSILDPRKNGSPLWPERHSLQKLKSTRSKDPDKFDCLYQGDPVSKEGLLYQQDFKTYTELPEIKKRKNYTDTADTGKDKLCSINYAIPLSKVDEHIYITDVIYTDEPMENTEPLVSNMLIKGNINESNIESNNGGRGFSRNVDALNKKQTRSITVNWFHQSGNKESRIYSQSANVNRTIVFPSDWHIRWPDFYKDVTKYKKIFSANKFDDAPDTLTGIIEKETKRSNSWGSSRMA
ncbi:MAG: phage terminase large subunit, partial [Kangiellaceae bacterium]|nr:phage terminase large subunit [Kangiellaceae bacterium]